MGWGNTILSKIKNLAKVLNLRKAVLPDIGPTVLHLMGFETPKEMTADCLIEAGGRVQSQKQL